MRITDELRKWVKSLYTPNSGQVKDEALRIADRIDAAYKNSIDVKNGDAYLKGYAECHAELMEGNEVIAADLERAGWIQLPKDADGVTIHLQDLMSWDNGMFNVHELNLTADGWTTWDEPHGYTVRADQCRHVQPDSWERIIEDAQADGVRYHNDGEPSDFDALVERCKRLAGGGA